MKIHCLRHEPFEGLASIENWILSNNHQVSYTYSYLNQSFPTDYDFDMLIIMGGTASVYNVLHEGWMIDEMHFVEGCLKRNKYVFGVCLGSQILAHILGGRVYQATEPEIGWYPVRFNLEELSHLHFLPEELVSFHWHGDTYTLPEGAIRLGSSDLTENQGFVYGDHVAGLQFHPEMTLAGIQKLIRGTGWKLKSNGRYIQSSEHILNQGALVGNNLRFTFQFLDQLVNKGVSVLHANIA